MAGLRPGAPAGSRSNGGFRGGGACRCRRARRRAGRGVPDDRQRRVGLVEAHPAPVRRIEGGPDEPAYEEVVGDDQLMARCVTVDGARETGDGRPRQRRAALPLLGREPGQVRQHAVGRDRRQFLPLRDVRDVVPRQLRLLQRYVVQLGADQARGLRRSGKRAVVHGTERTAREPLAEQGGLPAPGVRQLALVVRGLAVPGEVEVAGGCSDFGSGFGSGHGGVLRQRL